MFNKCLELYVNRKDVATCEKNIKELNSIHLFAALGSKWTHCKVQNHDGIISSRGTFSGCHIGDP